MTAASAHGRFQPFHNEHLEYLLAAQRQCSYLWIGITKYDITPTDSNPLGRPRERPANNPLTFFERINIIDEALVEAGIDRKTFGFVPFPIETPHRLPDFMPISIPCLTTICEQWNQEKIGVLRGLGYNVQVLYEREKKGVSGSTIRRQILTGDDGWKAMVPGATVRAVERLGLCARLLKLSSPDNDPKEAAVAPQV